MIRRAIRPSHTSPQAYHKRGMVPGSEFVIVPTVPQLEFGRKTSWIMACNRREDFGRGTKSSSSLVPRTPGTTAETQPQPLTVGCFFDSSERKRAFHAVQTPPITVATRLSSAWRRRVAFVDSPPRRERLATVLECDTRRGMRR